MKKFALFLAALLLFSIMTFPASASGGQARFYLTGDTNANVGDTVKITLHIDGEFEAHIINLKLYFDNTSFRYIGRSGKEAYQAAIDAGGVAQIGILDENNAIVFGLIMITDPATEPGEFVEFSFEVLSSAAQEAPFNLVVKEFKYMPIGETNGTSIDFTSEDLTVRINGGTGSVTTPVPSEVGSRTSAPISTPRPANTTPTPRATAVPGTPIPTLEPGTTPDPNRTPEPGKVPDPNLTPDPNTTPDPNASKTTDVPGTTPVPGASDDPLRTADPSEGIPGASGDPDGKENPDVDPDQAKDHFTPAPGEGTGSQKALKTGLIIGSSLLLAAIIALAALLVIKKKKVK